MTPKELRAINREIAAKGEAAAKAKKAQHGGRRNPPGGRPKGVRVTMATRERIKGAMIISRLQKHVEGEAILDATQVSAGLGLLKFQLPTLQATDLTSGGAPLTVERVVFTKAKA